jgi:DNA-directed RNA polymerase II subunit RPB7
MRLMHELPLHPKHFGPRLKTIIKKMLIENVEGNPLGNNGYVITVTQINDNDISQGIIEDNGYVCFKIYYEAILFRPFKNEVLDAEVVRVEEVQYSIQKLCGVWHRRWRTHVCAGRGS